MVGDGVFVLVGVYKLVSFIVMLEFCGVRVVFRIIRSSLIMNVSLVSVIKGECFCCKICKVVCDVFM